ncbi:MAG: hypothetical protein OEW08_08585 [Gammaproteobacteria bacterium]|nr:hypothetical protein [Gammaproteobacteria bacterium]
MQRFIVVIAGVLCLGQGALADVVDQAPSDVLAATLRPALPLSNALELNLTRQMLAQNSGRVFSGGVIHASRQFAQTEVAVNFSVSQYRALTAQSTYYDAATVDIHARRVWARAAHHFYVGGLLRGAYERGSIAEVVTVPLGSGTVANSLSTRDITQYGRIHISGDQLNSAGNARVTRYTAARTAKLGVGVGVGYRYVAKSGLFWGSGVNFGRYLSGDNGKFVDAPKGIASDDQISIVDVDFLKLGYLF